MKSKGVLILIILGFLLLIGLMGSDDSSSSLGSGRYGNGKEYDEDIYEIAEVYGEDPDVVNEKINRVVDAMN